MVSRARESPDTADSIKILINGARKIFYPPSQPPRDPGSPGAAKLGLEWVYGYRGRDARANLHLLPTGEMTYFVAAVVVLYNVEDQSQRHYLGHTQDIRCMSLHPNKLLIATGQGAGADRAHVR